MVEATENPGLPLVCWYRSSPGLVCGTGLIAQLEVVFAGGYAGGDREGGRGSAKAAYDHARGDQHQAAGEQATLDCLPMTWTPRAGRVAGMRRAGAAGAAVS
jgi:hypothetical protein